VHETSITRRLKNIKHVDLLFSPKLRNRAMGAPWQQAGFMRKMATENQLFSRSENLLQKPRPSESFSRTFSFASKGPRSTGKDMYFPVNNIQPEVRALLTSWELVKNRQQGVQASQSSLISYDPLRVTSDFSRPPSRFHRNRRKLIRNTIDDNAPGSMEAV
jgi:hypothetical protein